MTAQEYFQKVSVALSHVKEEEVQKAVEILVKAWKEDGRVWIVGNGGSLATASHFANDLVKMAEVSAFAVGDMGPLVTAMGNDNGWEDMYAGVVFRMWRPGDVTVGISCGGNSQNVVNALSGNVGRNSIVLTGWRGKETKLAKMGGFGAWIEAGWGDGGIRVEEDCHLAICHYIAGAVKERVSGKGSG